MTLGSNGDDLSVTAEISAQPRVPSPLRALMARIDRAFIDLAEPVDAREAMYTVRSGLSDICALTEADPKILRAVDRLVSISDRLAEAATGPSHARRPHPRPARLITARRALARLDGTLVHARPSRIAVSLGRGW